MMLFFFAGRSILIVLLTFFSPVGSSPSRPHSRLVHVFQQREITITDQVTKTVFTTDNAALSSFITSLSRHRSTSVSSLSPFSSAFLSSITETSLSSSSITSRASQTPISAPSSSSSAKTTTPRSTNVLAPYPFSTTSATTLSIANESPIPNIAPPTSFAQITPSSLPSDSPKGFTDSRFWSNKGLVGGILTVVGLAVVGIVSFCIFTCVKRTKKNGSRRYTRELYTNRFGRQHGSSPSLDTYQEIDPFAAGSVVQVPGSAASLHRGIGSGMVSSPSTPNSKTGHGSYSDDGHSSHDHCSSTYHGFSNIFYHTGFSGTHINYARPGSPLLSRVPRSVPPPLSLPEYPPEDLFSNPVAMPLSANTVLSTYATPSPLLGAGRTDNHHETESDYVDQIHSSCYAGATTSSVSR